MPITSFVVTSLEVKTQGKRRANSQGQSTLIDHPFASWMRINHAARATKRTNASHVKKKLKLVPRARKSAQLSPILFYALEKQIITWIYSLQSHRLPEHTPPPSPQDTSAIGFIYVRQKKESERGLEFKKEGEEVNKGKRDS